VEQSRLGPRFEDLFIIPHPASHDGDPRLLLLPGDDGWALPRWAHPARRGRTGRELDDPFWPAAIQRALRRQLDIDVAVLHGDLHDERDPETGDRRTVFVMEHLRSDWTPPPGARWVHPDEIAQLTLAAWLPRTALNAWFVEAATGATHEGRPAWQRPGWFATAWTWVTEQLGWRNLAPAGLPEQIGTKVARYLMRVPTGSCAVYFKAVPAMYARELHLLKLLAMPSPSPVPELLAVDVDRCWHLTRDHGGAPLTEAVELPTWERTLGRFGQLQVAQTERNDDLLAAGCTDLRLEAMAGQAEALFADTAAMLVEDSDGLTPDEWTQLVRLAPSIHAACGRLASYAIPPSLTHGDFIPGNVAVVDCRPVFLDWCEATVSHPFFSVVRFLSSAWWHGRAVRDAPDLYARLLDSYLRVWTFAEPMERLAKAFELAEVLQPLQYALTYWHLLGQLIAEGTPGTRWERRRLIALSLRRLLAQGERLRRL
jgi:hypothetical protein